MDPTRVHIRPYHPDDRAVLTALAGRLQVGVAPWRDPRAVQGAVRSRVADSIDGVDPATSPVFVAADGAGVLGFVSCGTRAHWSGATDASVGELVVADSAQQRGVGRALMVAAQEWARERGHLRLTIETGAANRGARAFYTRLGFAEEEVVLSLSL